MTVTLNYRRLGAALFLLFVVAPLLGSSAPICDIGGDVYNRSYDQSGDYWDRWTSGRAQLKPYWTPDSSHILFGHAGRIYIVDAAGSYLRSISGPFDEASVYSQTAELDFSPSLSPDGNSVAYTTLRYAAGELYEHTYEIATQPIDGSDRQRLTRNDWHDVSPAWSPDGSRIAFISTRDGTSRVFTIAPDGKDERNIAPSISAQTDAPVWSPDGSRVAFVGVELETTDVDWLDTYHSHATPTPRVSRRTIRREAVYVVKADGSGLAKLEWSDSPYSEPRTRVGVNDLNSPEEGVGPFRWSPDGSQVAFVARYYGEGDELYVASHDGWDARRVMSLSSVEDLEKYEEVSIRGIAWSPDGSRISLEAGGTFIEGDHLHADYVVYTLRADGTELNRLIHRKGSEQYYDWPASLWRVWPPSEPWENYGEWPDLLERPGPSRIVRYEKNEGGNLNMKNTGWVLALVAWDGSEENLLVRSVGDRVVAVKTDPVVSSVESP